MAAEFEQLLTLLLARQERILDEVGELKKGLSVLSRALDKAFPVLVAFQKGEELHHEWQADHQDRLDKGLRYLETRSARLEKNKSSH